MNHLLLSGEAAVYLRVKPQTLRVWRLRGCGPKYVRYGGRHGRVCYRIEDLEDWVRTRIRENTSQESSLAAGNPVQP